MKTSPSRKKILVVEDDDAIRESMLELLEGEGYLVSSAENGQIALDSLCAATELPDLILLDLMMPIKDGFQFCSEKALNEKIAKVPVIVMSAYGQIQEKQEKARAVAHIRKPFDIDHVIETVKRFCG